MPKKVNDNTSIFQQIESQDDARRRSCGMPESFATARVPNKDNHNTNIVQQIGHQDDARRRSCGMPESFNNDKIVHQIERQDDARGRSCGIPESFVQVQEENVSMESHHDTPRRSYDMPVSCAQLEIKNVRSEPIIRSEDMAVAGCSKDVWEKENELAVSSDECPNSPDIFRKRRKVIVHFDTGAEGDYLAHVTFFARAKRVRKVT